MIPSFIISELENGLSNWFYAICSVPGYRHDCVQRAYVHGMLMLPPMMISLPFKVLFVCTGRRLEPGDSIADLELQVGAVCVR